MLKRILPRSIDNSYNGHQLAIWLLILIILIRAGQALTSLFIGRLVAQGAHNINVAGLPAEAVQLMVLLLARSALATLVLILFSVLVLIRYRAMIPVTYVLLLIQHTGSAIIQLRESDITGTSKATVVSFVLLFLVVAGLFASLRGGANGAGRAASFPGHGSR